MNSTRRKKLKANNVSHRFSQSFGWEDLGDLEEDVMDMITSIVPNGEFPGLVKVTVEYLPEE